MNILVMNGSPKGQKSNTLKLTNAFLDGLNQSGIHIIESIDIVKKQIEPCKGCFSCWEKTPGKCVINDDVEVILEKYINADIVIWSFPLYYYGIPSKTKAFIDRLLPTNLPDIIKKSDGTSGHPARYDLENQKHILISTCGFFTIHENYEALVKHFEILFGNTVVKILCPEGELFSVPQLEERTGEYLSFVKKAGEEYNEQGCVSDETQHRLCDLLYPPEQFMEMANISWEKGTGRQETKDEAHKLLRQMAVLYKPHRKNKKIVFEFYFTELDKTYQLVLEKTKCTVKTEDYSPYTIRIETPFALWSDISNGKISGMEALFRHKYRILGDFSAIYLLDMCFSTKAGRATGQTAPQKTSMLVFIIPWAAFWMANPLSPDIGVYIVLIVTAAMPLLLRIWKLTIYDALSIFCVIVLSVLTIAGFDIKIIVTVSYGLFGLLWLGSILFRIPLSAWYSSGKYGGDSAFENNLFLLTNKIICIGWGCIYLLSCTWTWAVVNSYYMQLAGLINMICPVIMGIFTAVFSKWFPAHYARKTK
ncbi:MAG: flavodoxin family protein [Treponema sp.]|nr:flavodoxin family protein [Treponema sp.]